MDSIDFKFFIENDSNPFVLFSNLGKIEYLNTSAELLMGSCQSKELFEIALTYAPKSFGYHKTIIDLSFGSFEFYGINVLYENDNFLGIHLYNKPMAKVDDSVILEGFTLTNINVLLQANIELFSIHYQGDIKLLTDYEIPEFQMHQNNFSLLLRNIFAQFINVSKLQIALKIKLGERIAVHNKRYAILILEIKSDSREKIKDKELELIALQNHVNAHFREASITLEIPAIK